ncbi:MAG: hypothetical protein RLZZ290_1717 [Pseudomonadota bacterium]|jgi:MurNAc alpha-1-phosphate uridylyltransferase
MMQGMILAAGRGERMRPLTDHTPKPLLKAGHQTLMEWQLTRLVQAGVTHLVVNTAHLGEQIPALLGDGARYGAQLRYSPEPPGALETAGGIATAEPWRTQPPHATSPLFALANGDVFIEFDWAPLLQVCEDQWPKDALAMLVMVPNPEHHPRGDFAGFEQHSPYPLRAADASRSASAATQTYAGIGVFHRALFASCAPGVKAPLGPLLHRAAQAGQLWGWSHAGLWVDVGTPERLAALNARLK